MLPAIFPVFKPSNGFYLPILLGRLMGHSIAFLRKWHTYELNADEKSGRLWWQCPCSACRRSTHLQPANIGYDFAKNIFLRRKREIEAFTRFK
jgi:hypothetical protein